MESYFSDIRWGYNYLRGSGPANLEFVLALSGFPMPEISTACELAFGQGLTLNINAATRRDTAWFGTDFNPGHVRTAERLASICSNGAAIYGHSFDEFCSLPDLPEFDLIVLSGTWSWVSDDDRRTIVKFVDDHLSDGGIFILHYEALPGALDHSHLRNLILDYIGPEPVSGSRMASNMPDLIDGLRQIIRLNPVFMGDYPELDDLLDELKSMPPDHVAHEYFNRHWKPFRFSEIAAMLNPIGLQYGGLLDPLETVDAVHLTAPQSDHLDRMPDRNAREAIRDFFVRRSGRTDCWVRGAERLSAAERDESLSRMQFVRTKHQPLDEIVLYGALGEFVLGQAELQPVVDALPLGVFVEAGELVRTVPGAGTVAALSQHLALLNAARLIEMVPPDHDPAQAEITASRLLNKELCDIAAGGEEISTFAAPALGGGYSIGTDDLPFLSACLDGAEEPEDMAAAAQNWLDKRAEGRKADKKTSQHHTLRSQAGDFTQNALPVLKRLAIL